MRTILNSPLFNFLRWELKKVLFVCTGNICRSPMAEGLLRKLAGERGIRLEALSAGLAAFPGLPATPEAIEAAGEMGIDLSGHQSQPLGKGLILESDLILTMTAKHKETILRKMPDLAGKVRLFSEFAGDGEVDVEDPMDQPVGEFRKVLAQMRGYLERSLENFK